jgi:hypothetical protein
MKLSLYTFVKDGLRYDYHVVAMLRYHARLFDEIVVVEGFSSDGTFEAISGIDPKIRIIRCDLGAAAGISWYAKAKDRARKECTGEWCVLLDCDEFLPEWEAHRLRSVLEETTEHLFPLRFFHFYGNYKVYQRTTHAVFGYRIHRNLETVEVWGDGSDVRIRGVELAPPAIDRAFDCHHFGEVRHAAQLREKWRAQARRHQGITHRDWLPRVAFKIFPHKWCDPEITPRLQTYEGPFISAVRENPQEFVRDNFQVYRWLQTTNSRQPMLLDSQQV